MQARNELQSIRREKLDMLYQLRNEKRLLENDIQVARKNQSDLREAQDQMQQSFDTLVNRVNNATYRAESIQQFVLKLKRTNKDYVKVKEVAENYINAVLSGEGNTRLLSAALESVIASLKQDPNACANLVFADNNNENNGGGIAPPDTNANASANNNIDNEYQKGILMLAKNFFNTFVNQTTNQTMSTLEIEEAEDTEE